MSKQRSRNIILVLPILISATNIYAGGFQMHEQNASLGDVHAAYSVDTSNASINFYNPAGLTEILTSKTTSSAVTVANSVSFRGTNSFGTYPETNRPAITHSGKASTSGVHVIPSMHYATPISENMAFGLSIASPFAAQIDWSDKNFTKYNSTSNGIKTINFSPSLAYKLNNELSLGLGGDIQYVDMEINKVVGTNFDFTFKNQPPESFDSIITNTLSHTGLGWHGGLLWKPNNKVKVGYSYRYGITHKASGESKLKGKLAGYFTDLSPNKVNKSKNLKSTIRTPSTMAISAELKPNFDLTIVSTVLYTKWDKIKSFDLENVPTSFSHPDTGMPLFKKLVRNTMNFKNTYTFLNGMHYKYSNSLLLKAGFGYDQTPTSDLHRDLKMPDGNRLLFGLGSTYNYAKGLDLEFGWMFVNVLETKIYKKSVVEPPDIEFNVLNPGEQNEIYGSAKAHAHLFGLQFTIDTSKALSYMI